MRVIAFAAFSAFLFPALLFAHGMGASLEAVVGEYTIDIGYDPREVRAGERVLFDFSLLEKELPAEFDRVWVRMKSGDVTYLATGVGKAAIGPTTLLLVLPEEAAGTLQLLARFEREGIPVVEKDFSVDVLPASQEWPWALIIAAFGAGFAGGAGLLYISRKYGIVRAIKGDVNQ